MELLAPARAVSCPAVGTCGCSCLNCPALVPGAHWSTPNCIWKHKFWKLGLNQNCCTFAFILLVKIIMCSKFSLNQVYKSQVFPSEIGIRKREDLCTLGRMARGQTDPVRIRRLVLVVSILWGLHCPMGTENDEYPIHLPPRYPTKVHHSRDAALLALRALNQRGASLIRNCLPLGPYRRDLPRPLWWA
jgi:hypothetical protein